MPTLKSRRSGVDLRTVVGGQSDKSFVVSYAGHLYGPFNSAAEAATFGEMIPFAPWTIIQLRDKIPSMAAADHQWVKQQTP
jgi:hypothetical protein